MLTILLPLDGSELAEQTLPHARAIARSTDAKIVLLRAVAPTEFRDEDAFSRVDWRLRKQQAQSYLRDVAAELKTDSKLVETLVEEGPPADVILDVASRADAKLLIMCSHGSGGATNFPQGSIASKVLSTFSGSVLWVGAVRPGNAPDAQYRNILVPVDGSPEAECALRVAVLLAEAQSARLSIACVCEAAKVPLFAARDEHTRRLCNELTDITLHAADRTLASLRATLPKDLEISTSTHLMEKGLDSVTELAKRYNPDLVVVSAAMPDDESLCPAAQMPPATASTPILVLNPQDVGNAYCCTGHVDPPEPRTADAS